MPLWMWITWLLKGKKELKIVILDKTVLTSVATEHRSLNWILTQNKYCKPNRELYSIEEDYYGFFPQENKKFTIKDLDGYSREKLKNLSNKTDMVYLTDTYGIFRKEWLGENPKGEQSPKIYGGMTINELHLLEHMKNQHKLIITEFNVAASPTSQAVRGGFEDLFGLRWTGWSGRYYSSLDSIKNQELPVWLLKFYKQQHDGKWPFTKAGIVLVHESGRIEVLENEMHLNQEAPIILTNRENKERFQLPSMIRYSFWFDIMLMSRKNTAVSVFHIKSNVKGDSILNSINVPNPFPAVIEHYDKDYKFYYFCGDFCDNPVEQIFAYLWGIEKFRWLFYSSEDPEERASFFWLYYAPIMDNILDSYYRRLQK
jgi:hypothetical protein